MNLYFYDIPTSAYERVVDEAAYKANPNDYQFLDGPFVNYREYERLRNTTTWKKLDEPPGNDGPVMTEEEKIEAWWNAIKGMSIWSGAAVDISWSGLWEGAREDLRAVYRRATPV